MDKSIFASKTFWGVVIALAAPMLAKVGLTIDAEGWANDLTALAGAALAIYGRWAAVQPVRLL
jgi:hypothetical protein